MGGCVKHSNESSVKFNFILFFTKHMTTVVMGKKVNNGLKHIHNAYIILAGAGENENTQNMYLKDDRPLGT